MAMNIFLNADQVCKKLQIPKSTLYKLTRTKQIPHAKVGKGLRFNEGVLDEWFSRKMKRAVAH
ncbi:MAG: helix-turn-helix domain-containing protein [Desulfobacterales bacterium]|nr:helix-turn-helix domain-containing protein [Desulfobacterales bacterium]